MEKQLAQESSEVSNRKIHLLKSSPSEEGKRKEGKEERLRKKEGKIAFHLPTDKNYF